MGASLVATFGLVDWFIERGAILIHFQQSWSSHFGGVQSFEFGSPKEHAFDWSILPKNWDVTVPALVGICLLIKQGWKGLPTCFGRQPAAPLHMNPPVARCPLTLPSPPVGERVTEGRVRGFSGSVRDVLFRGILSPSDGERVILRRDSGLFSLVPLAWLALALVVFTNHKPWWSYYYVHIAIPLCWCAAVGIEFVGSAVLRKLKGRGADTRQRKQAQRAVLLRQAGSAVPFALFALCAAAWMGTRVYLQIAGVRNSPRLYTELVLKEIERLKPFTKWMYTDQIIYSFHADIPMPPPLAVVPLKRLWAGDMTRARIAAEISRFKPEIILLGNASHEEPFQRLLESDYRLIYQDGRQRLYAERATIKQADAAEVRSP